MSSTWIGLLHTVVVGGPSLHPFCGGSTLSLSLSISRTVAAADHAWRLQPFCTVSSTYRVALRSARQFSCFPPGSRQPASRPTNRASFPYTGPHGPTRGLRRRRSPPVVASQSNFLKVAQTVWKVGRDAIEAGTNLVPDAVPRPVARISVTFVGLSVALFVLKSFLSSFWPPWDSYFTFLALNKDNGPKGGGNGQKGGGGAPPMDDPVEEARKIMEKYK